MRPLELALLFLIGVDLLRRFAGLRFKLLGVPLIPAVAIIISSLQIGVEGYRWQLLPAYALAILLFLLDILPARSVRTSHPGRNWFLTVTSLLVFSIALALPVLLPVPALSTPDGPYPVGTTTYDLTDLARTDPYAPEAGAPRRILLQLWYPAKNDPQLQNSPWMEAADVIAPAIAEWINLPSFFLDHLALSKSPALQDAPVTSGSEVFPIVLFSHGYGGFRAQNTNQAIYLASHGYVVAAVEHTYGAVVTVFPDGEVAPHNPATLLGGLSEEDNLQAARRLGDQWAEDLAFALDRLSVLNQAGDDNRFTGRLNLEHVGVMGHSTGGGAAIEFCRREPRCDALLSMDPYMEPVSEQTLQVGLDVPSLHLFSETWSSGDNQATFERFAQASESPSWTGSITGTAHYDFTDLPLLTPLASMIGLKGPISGPRVVEIVDHYTLAFFEFALQGHPSALFPGLDRAYPELNVKELP